MIVKTKRLISLMVLLCLLLGLCPMNTTALSGDTSKIDSDKEAPAHDISVMSFNVLDYVSGTEYASPNARAPMVVNTIKSFMPDIIGIQEAGDPQSANNNFDWNDYLVSMLGNLGYDCRYLTQEKEKPSSMTIGAGLMIFYKRDRFDLLAHGSAQYKSDGQNGVYAAYEGFSRVDNSRYYHYVKLYDKVYGTQLYTFNTHLSVPVGSLKNSSNQTASDAQRTMLANITRTKQAQQLVTAMESMGADLPVFATGDYNSSWNTSKKDDPNSYQLLKMTDSGTFAAASDKAFDQISYFPTSLIDHVFFNTRYSLALRYRGVYEEYGGYQPSDHKAMQAYFNYCTPVTFASGSYDARNKTFEDSSETNQYTFELSGLPQGVSYKIFDSFGTELSQPVTLYQPRNQYTLKFYSPSVTDTGKPFFEVAATIRTEAAAPVDLSADGVENCYYHDGAYYLPALAGATVQLSTVEGRLFSDSVCSVAATGTFADLQQSTTLYMKSRLHGAVLPIHIIIGTAAIKENTLYVDGNIGNAKGTVAFVSDGQTVLGTAGTTHFATLRDAAAVANTANGYTVYVAPGVYAEGAVTFSKDITLLGNNDGIDPITRTDSDWLRAQRRAESVIQGQLSFTKTGNIALTVRGFKFYNRATVDHAIYQSSSNIKNTCTVDLGYNIFDFIGKNTTNSSCVSLNTSTLSAGNIHHSFFEAAGDHATDTMTRAFTIRTPKGLVIEENLFTNFDHLLFISSEISHTNLSSGYMDIIFRYNRFTNCNSFSLNNPTVTKDTYADIDILYNDFVECGNKNSDYALKFYLSDPNDSLTDLANYNINIFGNRFIGCQKGIYLRRNSTESDIKLATITITQNRFIGLHQRKSLDSICFNFDATSTKEFNATSENWKFSHNYYAADTVTGHHPDNFVGTSITVGSTKGNCINRSLLLPYYTDADLITLSDSAAVTGQTDIRIKQSVFVFDGQPHSVDIQCAEDAVISYSLDSSLSTAKRAWSSIAPTLTEVGKLQVYFMVERTGYRNYYGSVSLQVVGKPRELTFEDLAVPYDGNPHALTYTPLAGDTVTYLYDGKTYDTMPTFTDIGKYTVTVKVTNPEYTDAQATATLHIHELLFDRFAVENINALYNGKPYYLNITRQTYEEKIEYSVNGADFVTTAPAFVAIGSYAITIRVSQTNYETTLFYATVVIAAREETQVSVAGYQGVYDGEPHTITVSGTTEQDTLYYAVDGGAYTQEVPTFTEIGTHTVTLKICRDGYEDTMFAAAVCITQEPEVQVFDLTLTRKSDTSGIITIELGLIGDPAIFAAADIAVIEYGWRTADNSSLNLATETPLQASPTGICNFPTRIRLTPEESCAQFFIRYRIDGVLYEECSAVFIS